MKNVKKNIFNLVFLFLVFGLTIYGVFKGEDITEVVRVIQNARFEFIFFGIVCVVFFIWGESIIIYYLMGSLSIKLKKWKCFLFSSVGFFFSCITPSASGGQPMQIYYMRKEKIPIPVSTLVLMIVTITYKMVLVLIGVFLLLLGQGFVKKYLTGILPVFYLGVGLNVMCVTFMLILVFHPVLAKAMMKKGLRLLEKLHILKQKEERMEKLEESMDLYNETAKYLKSHAMEEKRQQETSEARKYYEGLPITTMAIILPILYLLKPCMAGYFVLILHIAMLVVGFLLILRFQLKKPGNKVLAVIVAVVALAVLKLTHII